MGTFYNNLINRTVCLLLTLIFLSTFPAGPTALAFCLDKCISIFIRAANVAKLPNRIDRPTEVRIRLIKV